MSLTRSQPVWLREFFGTVVGVAALVAAGWGLYEVRYTDERTPLNVRSANLAADDRTLRFSLSSCVGPLEVTQVPEDGAVSVTVLLVGAMPEVTPSCLGPIDVVLDEPLRGRTVIDGSDGGRLRVTTDGSIEGG